MTVKAEDYGEHNKVRRHDFTKPFKQTHPELKDCTDDNGPCWIYSKEERRAKLKNQIVDNKLVDKSKDELLFKLKDHLDPRRQYTIKVLQALAQEKGVDQKKKTITNIKRKDGQVNPWGYGMLFIFIYFLTSSCVLD